MTPDPMTPPTKPAGQKPAVHSGFLRNTGRSNSPGVSHSLSRILRNACVALLPRLALHQGVIITSYVYVVCYYNPLAALSSNSASDQRTYPSSHLKRCGLAQDFGGACHCSRGEASGRRCLRCGVFRLPVDPLAARTRLLHALAGTHATPHTHARTHARTHACTPWHARTHTRTHKHTHSRTHTHIHTHARTIARTIAHTIAMARTHAHTHVHTTAHTHDMHTHTHLLLHPTGIIRHPSSACYHEGCPSRWRPNHRHIQSCHNGV